MLFGTRKRNLIFALIMTLIFGLSSIAFARSVHGGSGSRRLDIFHYHNVGNIWMRISNYGFFGSGDDVIPQWPSLEYPGGSGIDYLYQGSLWFGACRQRRNTFGQKLYWQDESYTVTGTQDAGFGRVIDTLVSVGFDGDADMYEYLPAYNQLEENTLGYLYDINNLYDGVLEASIREQEQGVDDDGDGLIDEDPAGFAFPYRYSVPSQFSTFSSGINEFRGTVENTQCDVEEINDNIDIWFPLGFLDLGYIDPDSSYNFARSQDDDGDGLQDEDGYPLSEQDYLGYYYDYSPFGTPGERIWGGWTFGQGHTPLNVRVRQVSFQWSYEYIKNLVYVEFDITNMNPEDTLYDCAMGIYMDCDVGPQSWGADPRSLEDISSYVAGEGFEFAYTYDADTDNGLTTGYVGARVCTPDPEQLDFACWTWERGDGPHDENPTTNDGRNEKYWLLTNRNPDDSKFTSLREFPETQVNDPCDTRFLFAFYGDMNGFDAPSDSSWNLAPYETMKIVVGIFPGESKEELKRTSEWSKIIYGEAQTLTTVILPDTFMHYEAPGPPDYPKMALQQSENGDSIFAYWDNRSEFTVDRMTITKGSIGWQDIDTLDFLDSYYDQLLEYGYFPDEFAPSDSLGNEINRNVNATLNPWTANRLRHDFQGYAIKKRSNTGLESAWMEMGRWDKIETEQDLADYRACSHEFHQDIPEEYDVDFGGYLGIDKGLPQPHIVKESDPLYFSEYEGDFIRWTDYYKLDSLYQYTPVVPGNVVYGAPLYAAEIDGEISKNYDIIGDFEKEVLAYKNPNIPDDIYLALYDDKLIPLDGHLGQSHPGFDSFEKMRKARLARRFYKYTIIYPTKGVENYVSVVAFDRGIPSKKLESLESGEDANMITIFPGPASSSYMDNIYVVPNPYLGQSKFDGRRDKDEKGDRSKRIWFVNLPENCTIKIFTLAGDLVDEIKHNGEYVEDVINPSKASHTGIAASGTHSWDMLSRFDQIIASGIYLYSVEDHDTGYRKVDKFVVIK